MEEKGFPIEHLEEENRFVVRIENEEAELVYKIQKGVIYYLHTWVPQEIGNRGVAAAMAEKALNYAEENNLEVVAFCPYVKAYIEKHSYWQKKYG